MPPFSIPLAIAQSAGQGLDVSSRQRRRYETPRGASEAHPHRVDILQACRAQIPATGTTVYVGDGEWDQRAATALGWRFVGIGDRLRGKCPAWIPDFTAPDTFERIIG